MGNRWRKLALLLLLVLFLLQTVRSIGTNDSGEVVFFLFLPFFMLFSGVLRTWF